MNDSKTSHDKVMEFKDIPDGVHFQELGSNPRKFIKLHSTYASGIPFKAYTIHLGENDEPVIPEWNNNFNAIDYRGVVAKCPPWAKFEVIPAP
jgi:hypothetical protein